MKTITLETQMRVYDGREELPDDLRELLRHAEAAATRAYAKYSHFQVGAAVLMNNGQVVTGCNQENAVYPCGLCAERTAAFKIQDSRFKIQDSGFRFQVSSFKLATNK